MKIKRNEIQESRQQHFVFKVATVENTISPRNWTLETNEIEVDQIIVVPIMVNASKESLRLRYTFDTRYYIRNHPIFIEFHHMKIKLRR